VEGNTSSDLRRGDGGWRLRPAARYGSGRRRAIGRTGKAGKMGDNWLATILTPRWSFYGGLRRQKSGGDRSAKAEKAHAARVLGEGGGCSLGKTLGHKATNL
jgi:hypothetical protein